MHTLLRLRTELPEADTATLAAELAKRTAVALSPAALRQQLHRARTLFAELLLQEVRDGMDDPRPECVEQEIVDLGLLPYVREFL